MKRLRNVLLVLPLVGLGLAGCSSDSGSSATTTTGPTATTAGGGTTVNIDVGDTKGVDGPMTMTVSPASVPSGKVTFVVKNSGTIEHEMVVLKTDTAFDELAVDADDKVSEDTAKGEVHGFAEGTTDSITLDLDAGQYALVCNIAEHYGLGMRAAFSVT